MSEACHLGLPNSSDEMIPSGWEEQRGRADSRGSEIKPVCLHLLNTSNVAQPFKDVRRWRKKNLRIQRSCTCHHSKNLAPQTQGFSKVAGFRDVTYNTINKHMTMLLTVA
jgi:hypothetical protein